MVRPWRASRPAPSPVDHRVAGASADELPPGPPATQPRNMSRVGSMPDAGATIPASVQHARSAEPALTCARWALWSLVIAKLVSGWGVQWDIEWHVRVGRDTFWIPPHVMTYAGVAATVLLSFGMLAWYTARGDRSAELVRIFGVSGTRGFHLAAWGIALTVLAAPIDDVWHRLFGLDVTLWSPPHLLGILGGVINSAGCLIIAREAYPGHRLVG